jgi:AraC-like DNA-binding protein
MYWTAVPFGKYEGNTLSEIVLKDPDWHLFADSMFGYRNSYRIEQTKIILPETTLPVHDIAFMTGFEYPENFQKAFKKYWGYTPAELRKGK